MKKKFLSVVLTAAVLAGTIMFPAAVQAETTLAEAAELYAEKLEEYADKTVKESLGHTYSFALAYIDDDNIPEMIVSYIGGQMTTATVYSINGQSLTSADISASFGNLDFVQKENIIKTLVSISGAENTYFSSLNVNNGFNSLMTFECDTAGSYSIDGSAVSEDYYNDKLNNMINAYNWTSFSYIEGEGSFEVTASNISDMKANPQKYILGCDGISVYLDGEEIPFDQEPVILDGRTMVPLRAIFEAMGYTVSWDQSTQTAEAVKGSDSITVQLNNSVISYTLNGEENTYTCDTVPQSINGRTLVPVRAIGECAGCEVNWNSSSKTVTITSAN